MKEPTIVIIIIITIFAGFFIVTEVIGRASVYNEELKKERMKICLSEKVVYKECYQAIFSRSAFQFEFK